MQIALPAARSPSPRPRPTTLIIDNTGVTARHQRDPWLDIDITFDWRGRPTGSVTIRF